MRPVVRAENLVHLPADVVSGGEGPSDVTVLADEARLDRGVEGGALFGDGFKHGELLFTVRDGCT